MMRYFMGDTELKEADTIESVSAMGGVIKAVKQYHNEAGAIGYTFRYFLEELNQEDGVKILSIDGVYPSVEDIKNGKGKAIGAIVGFVMKEMKGKCDPGTVNKMITEKWK